MNGIKTSLSIALTFVLFLSFSVMFIPLGFLHNHQASEVTIPRVNNKVQPSCAHDLHPTKKSDSCWACAVHIDRSFTKISFIEKLKISPGISLFINNDTAGFIIESLFYGLSSPQTE